MARLAIFVLIFLSFIALDVHSTLEPSSWQDQKKISKTRHRMRHVRCMFPMFRRCFRISQPCPPECPFNCVMDCELCKPVCSCSTPGAVCQDPRFVGGDGNTFYFHGHKDKDFCLVSDEDFHINAHFIGKRNPKLTRDFTWVQSTGVIFGSHKLLIAAKRTATWDGKIDRLSLILDETSVNLPTVDGYTLHSDTAPQVSFTRNGPTNGVVVEVGGKLRISAMVVPITAGESRVHGYNITEDDCFAHLEIGFRFYNLSNKVDGILGQTYRPDYVSKAKPGAIMPVLGGTHKFISSGLYTTDCAVSQFRKHKASDITNNKDINAIATVQCTNMHEIGFVCKK